MSDVKQTLQRLTPGWFSAIAGAAIAGATLVPHHRILAGLGAGVSMLAIAIALTPCCDGCAAGQGCGASVTAKPPTLPPAVVVDDAGPVSTPPHPRDDESRMADPGALLARGACARGGCA